MRALTPLFLLGAVSLWAQGGEILTPQVEEELAAMERFYCPMDPDVRSKMPGRCTRCGMALVVGIPEPEEYPVQFSTTPSRVEAGKPVELAFAIQEPDSERHHGHEPRVVRELDTVHTKLFHLLYVSHDLQVFGHEHPQLGQDGIFRLTTTLPREGTYRLLADFYPKNATPQMIPITLTTAGYTGPPIPMESALAADMAPQTAENLTVTLTPDPPEPLAGFKTALVFELDTADGLQKFLGAWAHMLAVSADTVDMIHAHPSIADGGPRIQMNVIFPRPGLYRVWIQTQRQGVVNTAAFNLPVGELK